MEAKGKDASDIYKQIGEVSNSMDDILDMRNNKGTEFRYGNMLTKQQK
jgi:hypothetical protein